MKGYRKSDGKMTEPEGQLRQSLLGLLSCNTTFLQLHFNDEYLLHESNENDHDDGSDMVINALVFMTLTSSFDEEVMAAVQSEDYQRSAGNITLSLPFGDKPTSERLLQWVLNVNDPGEFVDRQYCIEFARFYGIRVPFHEDNTIIQDKINGYEDTPFLNEQLSDDSPPPPEDGLEATFEPDGAEVDDLIDADVSFYCDRRLVVIDEKILRRMEEQGQNWFVLLVSVSEMSRFCAD